MRTAEDFTVSPIVITFSKYVSRFILDHLDYFSGTTVDSTYPLTSPTGMSYFCTTSTTTAFSVSPSLIPDGSIASSLFKRASN